MGTAGTHIPIGPFSHRCSKTPVGAVSKITRSKPRQKKSIRLLDESTSQKRPCNMYLYKAASLRGRSRLKISKRILKTLNLKEYSTLPETNTSPLKIGRNPKRKVFHLPTIHFQGAFAVSFREGNSSNHPF